MKHAELPAWFYDVDVHTHDRRASADGAIVCITPRESAEGPARYSCGIHPWDAATATDSDFRALEQLCASPACVAVGECGLDTKHRPTPTESPSQAHLLAQQQHCAESPTREQLLAVQTPVFRRQIELSERLGKPLIIHCVGAVDELLALRRELRPRQPWIFHGFRGKPQQARQLTDHGIYLSLGPRSNPAVPATIPASFLLHESDTQ